MSPNMEKKRANRLQTAYILSRTLVSLSILAGSPSRTKECITGYPECKLTFMMSEKSVSRLQCWLSWPWLLSSYLTLRFFSKFVSRANNSKIYWPNEFPRKQKNVAHEKSWNSLSSSFILFPRRHSISLQLRIRK